MLRLTLMTPTGRLDPDEEQRLASLVRVIRRGCELAGFALTVETERAHSHPEKPAEAAIGWSGEFRTDEIAAVAVENGRVVAVR